MKSKNNDTGLGLRKGVWTAQEDMLLKTCIEKNGEGKWHLIPLKTGLNRCRKSCRLRWLNYLKPSIKKGPFEEDEVDLILRLHKLLGNRWSLIAGRIPGRTANDVKNYWNAHICPHPRKDAKESKENEASQSTAVTLVRPKPTTFSKELSWSMGDNKVDNNEINEDENSIKQVLHDGIDPNFNMPPRLTPSQILLDDDNNDYWDKLFDDDQWNDGEVWTSPGDDRLEAEPVNLLEQENDQFDFSFDDLLLDHLHSEKL